MTLPTTLPITPSFRLDGRRALVTGGSKGLGLAAAAALVQAGASVTLVARQASELIAACELLTETASVNSNQKQAIQHAALDVTDSKAVTSWMAQDIAQHGPFDILVNNAGMNKPSTLMDMKDADLDAVKIGRAHV